MADRAKQVETSAAPIMGVPQKPEPIQQTHVSSPDPVLQPRSARVQRRPGGPADILELQQTIGNQAVMRLLDQRRSAVQAKLVESSEEQSVQRLGEGQREPSNAEIHSAAARGISTPATPLPFLDRIQASFGRHSIGHIKAHVGFEAARASRDMNALAFASGDHVVFSGPPDLHTAAHEAAHVVQQQAGVQLAGGIGREGDVYERQADAVADAIVVGRSAEGLLGSFKTSPAPQKLGNSAETAIKAPIFPAASYRLVQCSNGQPEGNTKEYPKFSNRQPDNLSNEIARYVQEWLEAGSSDTYIVSFRKNQHLFHEKIMTGKKFLWTYDTDGALSIGSPKNNQHPVVAGGKDIYAGGSGQLVISDDQERYYSYVQLILEAITFRKKARERFEKGDEEGGRTLMENAKYKEEFVGGMYEEVPSRPPKTLIERFLFSDPLHASELVLSSKREVELDFRSGHYRPQNAWDKTYEAWEAAGYKVVRSNESQFV